MAKNDARRHAALARSGGTAWAGEVKFGADTLAVDDTGDITTEGKSAAVDTLESEPGEELWNLNLWAKIDKGGPGPLHVEFLGRLPSGKDHVTYRFEHSISAFQPVRGEGASGKLCRGADGGGASQRAVRQARGRGWRCRGRAAGGSRDARQQTATRRHRAERFVQPCLDRATTRDLEGFARELLEVAS